MTPNPEAKSQYMISYHASFKKLKAKRSL